MAKTIIATMLAIITVLTVMAVAAPADTVRVLITVDGDGQEIVSGVGGTVLHEYSILSDVIAVEVPEQALAGLQRNPHVTNIEFDAEVHIMAPRDRCSPWPACKGGDDEPPAEDPVQETPWGVTRIGADSVALDGSGTTVCIVDTGVAQHSDLPALVAGRNFVAKGRTVDPNKFYDDNGHGTHVAGTIAAQDNAIGVVGVAPQTGLLAAKVLDRRGSGYLSDVIAGVDWCVTEGADVISMSLGASSDVQALHDAVDAALAAGSLPVAAAGNDYLGPVSYPAAYESVMAVSAMAQGDTLASFSNVGPEVVLTAPGADVLSTVLDNGYDSYSGTSMATPHVSAVAALAKQANPLLGAQEIADLLIATADDLGAPGKDDEFGYGLVDATLG